MTCREKLKIEYPDKISKYWIGGCLGCPSVYGYLPDPEYCIYSCNKGNCTRCWDREIPELKETKEDVKMKTERKFYSCTEISQMSDLEKNGLIVRLQSDIASKNVDCIDLKNRLNDEIIKLENKNALLALDISRLEKSRCCDERVKTLEEEIEKLKNENKNLAESNYVLNDHIDEYEFVIKESDKEKAKLKNDIEHWNKSYAYLVEQNGVLEKKLEDSEICYKGRVVQCNELAEKVAKLEKEKDDLDRILHNKIEALEGDIECRKKDLEYKNDQIEDLVKRLDDQRKKIEDLENGDVLPYFIRKVVGDKLKEDPCCWATPAEKCNYIVDAICKSVPCSEAIKQLEKKVDDIPCIKAKNTKNTKNTKNELDDAIKDYIMKSPRPVCWDDYWPINHLGEWNLTDPAYDKTATHMMRKYKALRNAGFDHDTALSFIPMWSDE